MTNLLKVQQLKQFQLLSLESKIRLTLARIKEWHIKYEGNVYLSFSGGKDSTVLKHIIDTYYPDIPSIYCNTGLEYPEVKRFAMSQDNVTVITPKILFKDVLKNYGYPVISKEQSQYLAEIRNTKSETLRNLRINGRNGRYKLSDKWQFLVDAPFKISNKCCDVMKKAPFKKYEKETGKKPIIATMTDESALRLNSWLKHGCNAFGSKRPTSRPLSFWTEQDVLAYINKYRIPLASVYGEVKREPSLLNDGRLYCTGCPRTGCMFCMYGVHLEREPNRFQKMKLTHPRLYQYCIEELGLGEVLDFIGVKYV